MSEPLKLGSRVEIAVHDVAAGGEAVGRLDNFVIFVPHAAPGDQLEVEITHLKKSYARARISKIVKPSRRRVEPPCPIYYQCGGCQLQHIDYDAQLFHKTKMVTDSIEHLSNLGKVKVMPCRGMEDPWNYRNKAQAVVAAQPFLKEHKPTERFRPFVGLYAKGTHRVVKIDDCMILDPLNNQILRATREILERLQWPVYNEKDESGIIRYLVTRASLSTREALLVLVSAQPRLPQVQEFINFMRRRVPQLKGVMLNLNPHRSNVILGTTTRTLWGKDHLTEEVDGLKFHISPTSFFQVNTWGLKALYQALDKYCNIRPKDAVLDLYCGVGSLTLFLARKARRVVGIDSSAPAIEDAVVNSDLNELANTTFMAGNVERHLPQLYRQGERFSLVVLDPPRKGCDASLLKTIARMRIPNIVYVSCNPSTLARDLGLLAELGYQTNEIQPIDMFPQTYHVECVAHVTLKGGRR